MKVRLTARTEVDLLRAIDWFDRISIGLGEMFEAEFYRALEQVKANPELFAADHTGTVLAGSNDLPLFCISVSTNRSLWLSGFSPAAKMRATSRNADNSWKSQMLVFPLSLEGPNTKSKVG